MPYVWQVNRYCTRRPPAQSPRLFSEHQQKEASDVGRKRSLLAVARHHAVQHGGTAEAGRQREDPAQTRSAVPGHGVGEWVVLLYRLSDSPCTSSCCRPCPTRTSSPAHSWSRACKASSTRRACPSPALRARAPAPDADAELRCAKRFAFGWKIQ